MALDLKEILNPISEHLEKVDEDIKLKLNTGIPLLDNSSIHLFIKGGKKVRASLVLLTSGLLNDIPEGVVEIASATEIVHAATLVHDDIIDQSILRRGGLTVSKKWGNKVAVLAGDYMYTRALDSVVKDGNPLLFPVIVEGTNDMVKGELYQLQYSDISVINKKHYFNIIELKTARFMAACAKLGAIKAGLSEEMCNDLFLFGLNTGFAFQIVDDTLDVIGDELTGKDCGNDFMDGKVTLPFIFLLEKLNSKDREIFVNYAGSPDKDNWGIVKKELKSSGAIDYSIKVAEEYLNKAFENIKEFPESEFKNILVNLANFFVKRFY